MPTTRKDDEGKRKAGIGWTWLAASIGVLLAVWWDWGAVAGVGTRGLPEGDAAAAFSAQQSSEVGEAISGSAAAVELAAGESGADEDQGNGVSRASPEGGVAASGNGSAGQGAAAGSAERDRLERWVGRLSGQERETWEQLVAVYGARDLTQVSGLHGLLMEERAVYGRELTVEEAAAFNAWVEAVEDLAQDIVAERAAEAGLARGGRTADGRGFFLQGFAGEEPVYVYTTNVNAAISTNANRLRLNAAFDPLVGAAISGAGLYVNINDHGEIYQHSEFQLPNAAGSRIVLSEVPDYKDGDRSHMTHVAGTVAAWGYNSSWMGMAPRVWMRAHIQLRMADITGFGMQYPGQLLETPNPVTGEPQMRSVMGTVSLGLTDTFASRGAYTDITRAFDQVFWDYPYYVHFHAASNDGSAGYATLGQDLPVAKNGLTIGSVRDLGRDSNGNYLSGGLIDGFSSRGPTFDGRIKPDFTANGNDLTSTDGEAGSSRKSGTSMATPNASGSAVLLIDYFRQRLPGHFPRSSTVKALLMSTAEDLGNPGPDYIYGWGVINVARAAEIVRRFADTPQSRVIIEDTLAQGTSWSGVYHADGDKPLRISLAWLDPAGAVQSTDSTDRSPRLVNDLNLRVTGPDGSTVHFPFVMPFTTGSGGTPAYDATLYGAAAVTGNNFTDNAEQVVISAPVAGPYTVSVQHSGTLSDGSQRFSLAVYGGAAVEPLQPHVTAVSPQSGPFAAEDFFAIQVEGSGFVPGTDVRLRRAGSAEVAAYAQVISGERISGRVDTAVMAKGYWDVVVRTPDGTEAVLPNGFLLPIPTPALLSSDFSVDPGWQLEGAWSIGQPQQGAVGGPTAAYAGNNVLGTYLEGNYPNGLGRIHATSPAFSSVGASGLTLSFRRWMGIAYRQSGALSSRHADFGRVFLSTDGNTWTQVWANDSAISDSGWVLQSIPLPPGANNQPTLYLRFSLESDANEVSFGWNMDSLEVVASSGNGILRPPVFTSQPPTAPFTIGVANVLTITAVDEDTPGSGLSFALSGQPDGLAITDNGDGSATLSGSPAQPGTYTLTISVTDGSYVTYQVFDLAVLGAVEPLPQTPAEHWRWLWFNQIEDSGNAADAADPDLDGIINLLERAFGGNPQFADSSIVPSVWILPDDNDPAIAYRAIRWRQLRGGSGTPGVDYSADGLLYELLLSDDLAQWHLAAALYELVEPPVDNGDGTETVTLRVMQPLSLGQPGFLRLRVTRVAP